MKPRRIYPIIHRYRDQYPVSEMCRLFGVSRSGYYDYVGRMDKPDRDKPLADLIAQCQRRCNHTYGYRRVQKWLMKAKGIHRNPKTVLRIMRKYDLFAQIRRSRRYRQMGQQLHRYPNLLDRNFSAQRPNQKWVTDISYIHTAQGVLYLSVIRDLYDLSIISHKMETRQTVSLVLETIRMAVDKEKVTGELQLHSDQGFQYTSEAYFHLTQQYGITPSMSRRGNCYDNAMAENFFSILKTECIHRTKLHTFAQARQLIDSFIEFYNCERIQLKTGEAPLSLRLSA